jgi:hypothetical protein
MQYDLAQSVCHGPFTLFSISDGLVMFVPLVEVASTAYHVFFILLQVLSHGQSLLRRPFTVPLYSRCSSSHYAHLVIAWWVQVLFLFVASSSMVGYFPSDFLDVIHFITIHSF